MVRKLLLTAAAGLTLTGMASAQVVILGSSLGKECFTAVTTTTMPTSTEERACTNALNSGTLEGRDLTATYVNRGIVRMRMNKFDSALADYAVAKNRRPALGAIYLNEGAALIAMGDAVGAIDSLEKSIELDTQDAHAAYFNLGLAHELNGDTSAAYYSFRKALDLRPEWERAEQELARFRIVEAES
ncbi:MAG: tetratricopeptide repeat protein [Pseudomonadota bacterium]